MEISEPLWETAQHIFPNIQLRVFLQQSVLVVCHPLGVLLLLWGEPGCAFYYNPPLVEDGSEVPSSPALPQALQAQHSCAHHLSCFIFSSPWPSLWPPLGSLQFANSSLVLRGHKVGHSAPDASTEDVEQRRAISSLPLLAALWLMQPKSQLASTSARTYCCLTCCPPGPPGPVLQSLSRQPSLSHCVGLQQLRHRTWHMGTRQPFSAACPGPCPPAPPLWGQVWTCWRRVPLSRLLMKMLSYENI